MTDDAELLRRFAEEGSEDALAEVVRRRVDLVYGAAWRQVRGNGALAEEITQAVFTELARKAGRLARHPALVGWLHTATRFATTKALRAESRRRAREQEAFAMNEVLSADEGAEEWERLRPVIDEALGELKERERAAILLRYFEKKPLAEVGAALALTETAARSCVDRALEKLHAALARRGITSTAAALGAVLAGQAGVAAPAGLAASATAAALAGGNVASAVGMAGGAGGVGVAGAWTMNFAGLGIVAMASVSVALWISEGRAQAELREEIAVLRREGGEVERLVAENQRLARTRAEVVELRRDDEELARLRDEAAELKERLGRKLAAERAAGPMAAIAGMIRMPGKYPLQQGVTMTLAELLAKAGGTTGTANLNKIRVARSQPDGATKIYVKDLEGGDGAFALEAGDLVYVPERII